MEAGSAADPENPAPTIQLPEIDNSGSTADLENPAPTVQLPEIDNSGSTADLENPAPTVQLPEIDNSGSTADVENPAPTVHLPKLDIYVSSRLHKAAKNGKWEEAAILLHDNPSIAVALITDEYESALHVATGANQAAFVTEIIKWMEPEHLEMRDGNENTAFAIAAITGNVEIATVMLDKNLKLQEIEDSRSKTPLHMAVFLGKNDMAVFLYDKSTESEAPDYLTFEDRTGLFFQSIKNELYDLALKFVKDRPVLAVIRDGNGDTALHVLARQQSSIFEMTKSTGNDQESMSTPALQLLNHLWNEAKQNLILVEGKQHLIHVKRQITKPSNLLFDAARLGNFKFLEKLICSYPSFVDEFDEKGQTIFHVAIFHRQTSVFDLIHKIGFRKEIIAAHMDYDDNTLLHLAAKYSKQSRDESRFSSPALEMQDELIKFQEYEDVMQPSLRRVKNKHGLTPRELFTNQHRTLQRIAAQWMNNTATSCSLVATLITTVVFAAAFAVPGGTDDKTGTPIFLKKTWFRVFAISDTIALTFSSFSILMFLSILSSKYTQSQFHISLPLKLFIGLLTLFTSIIFMMITFGSTFFLLYNDQSLCIPILTFVFVSAPITVFVLLHYHLLKDIFCLTHRSGFLSKLGFLCKK